LLLLLLCLLLLLLLQLLPRLLLLLHCVFGCVQCWQPDLPHLLQDSPAAVWHARARVSP
jgi:hypothetical protein